MECMYLQQLKNAIHGCSKSNLTSWSIKVKMKRDKQFPKQTYQSECGKNFYSQFLSLWESLIPFCINVGGQSGCKAVHLDWVMPSWLAPTLLHSGGTTYFSKVGSQTWSGHFYALDFFYLYLYAINLLNLVIFFFK